MAEKLGEAVLELRTDSTKLISGMRDARSRVQQFGKGMTQTGRSLSIGLTVPLVAAGTAATKMAMDFEKSMSEIVGLVGVSQDQVDEWSQSILQLGPQLGKSPKELADAMFFITSAGLQGSEALDTLVASAKASAAGLGDITQIADAVTSAMNAYGAENMSASQATDILVATVREGKLSADELAGSIGRIIPLAASMGVEFDEVGAALASMTRIGFSTDEAATSLQATMSALLKPSVEAEESFRKLGTSASELRQRVADEGLLLVLADLEQRVDGDTAAMAEMFPNVRALRGVLGLLGENADSTAAIMESLGMATGSTDAAFEVASETLEFKMNVAMAYFKTALAEIGAALGPVIVPMIQRLAEGIRQAAAWFKDLNPETQRFLMVVAGAAAALGPTLVVLGTLLTTLTAIAGVISGAALPWILLAGAIAGAAYLIIKNWDDVKATAIRFADNVTLIWDGLKEVLGGIFERIYRSARDWLVDKFEDMVGWLELTWAKVSNAYTKARNFIVGLFGGEEIEPIDISALEAQLDQLDRDREKRTADIQKQLTDQIQHGKQQIAQGAGDIAAQAAEMATGVADMFTTAWGTVSELFQDMFGGMKGTFAQGTGEMKDDLAGVGKQAEATAEQVEETAIAVVERTGMTTEEIAAQISEEIKGIGAMTDQELLRMSLEAYKQEQEMLEERKAMYQDFGETVIGTFARTFGAMMEDVIKGNATLWEAFKTAGLEAIAGVLEALGEMAIVKAAIAIAEAISAFPNFAKMGAQLAAAAKFTAGAVLAFAAAGAVRAFEYGGIIDEPVVGVGLQSGSAYTLAERGPEQVGPVGGGAGMVRVVVNLDARPIIDAVGEANRDGLLIIDARTVR